MESSHNLTITGNLFVEGGGVPVVPTIGTHQINVNYTVPVQAQGISTSGSTGTTAAEIVAELLASLNSTVIPVNVKKINDTPLAGNGTPGNGWGPA